MVVELFIKFKTKTNNMKKNLSFITASCFSLFLFASCNNAVKPNGTSGKENKRLKHLSILTFAQNLKKNTATPMQ
jgi:hypothetical protein